MFFTRWMNFVASVYHIITKWLGNTYGNEWTRLDTDWGSPGPASGCTLFFFHSCKFLTVFLGRYVTCCVLLKQNRRLMCGNPSLLKPDLLTTSLCTINILQRKSLTWGSAVIAIHKAARNDVIHLHNIWPSMKQNRSLLAAFIILGQMLVAVLLFKTLSQPMTQPWKNNCIKTETINQCWPGFCSQAS